jgi:hypothetical protein
MGAGCRGGGRQNLPVGPLTPIFLSGLTVRLGPPGTAWDRINFFLRAQKSRVLPDGLVPTRSDAPRSHCAGLSRVVPARPALSRVVPHPIFFGKKRDIQMQSAECGIIRRKRWRGTGRREEVCASGQILSMQVVDFSLSEPQKNGSFSVSYL